jgi:hypothetical protein
MAVLTAAARKKLKPSQFALPGGRYPIQDRRHAIDAKGRAKEELKAGKLSRAEYNRIVMRANRMLEKSR